MPRFDQHDEVAAVIRACHSKETDDEKHQNDDEKDVDQLPGLRDSGDAARPEIAKKPQHQQDHDQKLEHAFCSCNLGAWLDPPAAIDYRRRA